MQPVRVLVFHGYLLRGTGSNVYNASLARALARLGHQVHLLCQERAARELPWVNAVGAWGPGGLEVEPLREPAGGEGSVTVYTPEIGGLLPVYVSDRYQGFEVKTFPELSDDELERYLDANVAAVRDVVASAGEPGAALANHLIMGPAILARAGLEFAAKVHGSDLSYTVRPHPDRFLPFAREGAAAAAALLVGSRHTAESLWETVGGPDLPSKTRLGPPGVDVESFRRRAPAEAARAVEELAAGLAREPAPGGEDSFSRDGPAAAGALRHWLTGSPRVLFVGKLLVNKGADLLLAAWPLVVREHPDARLLMVGFGAYGAALERLWGALERGDLGEARRVAGAGRALEAGAPGPAEPLPILSAFLADPPGGYAAAAGTAAGSVAFAGRLEHAEVAAVLPNADAFVMPSTFPEAFGMVAAEAAACGVPPVSADHSGMREVSRQLAEAIGPELAPLLSFAIEPGAVEALSERLLGWLALGPGGRERAAAALAARAAELWSWEGVARSVLDASRGRLEGLPRVPGP
jgi:glycosyltransferase involved in cell wall biosynthesis